MNVTLPDGTVLQNVPDGTSRADLITKLKGNGFDTSALEQIPAPAPPAAPISTLDRLKQGIMDPLNGAAQLLTHILPSSVVQAGNSLNNYLADKTGLVAPLPPGGLDQQIQTNEAQYQAGRQAADLQAQQQRAAAVPSAAGSAGAPTTNTGAPGQGLDWTRIAGNLVSPTNLAMATRIPAAATLAGRVAQGAGVGAVGGATAPVTQGDYTSQKLMQVGAGAAAGAAVPLVTGTIGRLISPAASTDPSVQTLTQAGVQPSIGQTLGGLANNLEQKATSIPLIGNLVSNARVRPYAQVQQAVANRALAPIGQTAPDLTGNALVEHVGSTLSDGYNKLLPTLTTQGDAQFFGEVNNLRNMMANGSIDPAKANQFENILQNQVLSKFQPGANGAPTITGETMKGIQSDLGQLSSKFGRSLDPDQQMVGDALGEVQNSLKDIVTRSNPDAAPQLNALNEGWANFKRLQKAASGTGTDDGSFSPAQLQSAVRALDRSKDKADFASGNALMQDLSGAAKSVLGPTVPDSGTAGRLLTGAALAGGAAEVPNMFSMALNHPILAGAAAASPLLYSPWGQNFLRSIVASRPALAQPIANALQKATPGLVPLGGQLGLQPLN